MTSPRSPTLKEKPTPTKATSTSITKCTPRIHARATIAKKKWFEKRVLNLIKTKQTSSAADAHVHRGHDDKLDAYMLPGVGKNAKEVWSHPVDEKWIMPLWFRPYVSKTVEPGKYDYVTLFLDDTLTPRHQHVDVFLSKTEVNCLPYMV